MITAWSVFVNRVQELEEQIKKEKDQADLLLQQQRLVLIIIPSRKIVVVSNFGERSRSAGNARARAIQWARNLTSTCVRVYSPPPADLRSTLPRSLRDSPHSRAFSLMNH